ncbi:50S ribosomal L9 C-terminal domain-containing protein, partial [Cytobacillus oceanisediminis]|uniref:50S ribosomal L9 C-terminal domain-containing protein n=1 Tax=Cytobacillus oceanisediminis TaxID=665099 RepID=UPI0028D5F6E5
HHPNPFNQNLQELTLQLSPNSREHPPLFPSITTNHIPHQLQKPHKINLHKRKIHIHHPIPTLPYTKLPLKLHKQLHPTFNLHLKQPK